MTFRVKFFSFKVPEFFKKSKKPCCVDSAHLDILSLFFSETKCKPGKKNTGECVTAKLKSTYAKIQALLKGI